MSVYNGVLYAGVPPRGVTPDPSQPFEATALIVTSCIFYPLAVISTGIRLYSRAVIVGKTALDDYIMVLALLLGTVMLACTMHMLHWGLGMHYWNVPMVPNFLPNFQLPNIIAAIHFCLATGLAKGSILLFYLRIFPMMPMRITVRCLFTFTVGYSIASAFVNVFSCDPIVGSWRMPEAATAKCINRPVFYLVQASLSILTDVTTVVAPLPVLRTLQLPAKQKIGVGVLLTIGAFVCVVSAIRLKSLYTLLTDSDLTCNTVDALMWCIIELNLSILGGNIPALKPFIQQVFPRLLGTSYANGGAASSKSIYIRSDRGGNCGNYAARGARSGGGGSGNHGHRRIGGGTTCTASSSKRDPTDVMCTANRDGTHSDEFIVQDNKVTIPLTPNGGSHREPVIHRTVEFGYEEHELDETRPFPGFSGGGNEKN